MPRLAKPTEPLCDFKAFPWSLWIVFPLVTTTSQFITVRGVVLLATAKLQGTALRNFPPLPVSSNGKLLAFSITPASLPASSPMFLSAHSILATNTATASWAHLLMDTAAAAASCLLFPPECLLKIYHLQTQRLSFPHQGVKCRMGLQCFEAALRLTDGISFVFVEFGEWWKSTAVLCTVLIDLEEK